MNSTQSSQSRRYYLSNIFLPRLSSVRSTMACLDGGFFTTTKFTMLLFIFLYAPITILCTYLLCCCCSKSRQYSKSSKLELPPHFEQLKTWHTIRLHFSYYKVECFSLPLVLGNELYLKHGRTGANPTT